jgi:hypothetical protein
MGESPSQLAGRPPLRPTRPLRPPAAAGSAEVAAATDGPQRVTAVVLRVRIWLKFQKCKESFSCRKRWMLDCTAAHCSLCLNSNSDQSIVWQFLLRSHLTSDFLHPGLLIKETLQVNQFRWAALSSHNDLAISQRQVMHREWKLVRFEAHILDSIR